VCTLKSGQDARLGWGRDSASADGQSAVPLPGRSAQARKPFSLHAENPSLPTRTVRNAKLLCRTILMYGKMAGDAARALEALFLLTKARMIGW
jgi:hypothetical protein